MERYIHDTYTHNNDSPFEIVHIIGKTLNPQSVVDVGCGTGTFLNQFKKIGVKKVLGIDGPWVNRNLLSANLEKSEFREMNLEEPIKLNERFDLAICVEVAEHLEEKYSDNLIQSLTSLSDLIIFSGAIPYQGGQNHLNEQWMDYWTRKFTKHDYVACDILRPVLWNNKKIQWWYRQNLFFAYKKSMAFNEKIFDAYGNVDIKNYVHPDLFLKNSKRMDDIVSGRMDFLFYVKLIGKKMIKMTKLTGNKK